MILYCKTVLSSVCCCNILQVMPTGIKSVSLSIVSDKINQIK